jgi:hypothetical protein
METKFRIVETEGYTLAVSGNEYNLYNTSIQELINKGLVIGYKPKDNAKELDLPLLPDVEDNLKKLYKKPNLDEDSKSATAFIDGHYYGFEDGYKAATKVFSEEDLKKMFAYAHQVGMNTLLQTQSPHLLEKQDEHKLRDGFIQSLKQPTPKWFVAEMKCGRCYIPLKDDDCWSAKECSRNSKNDLLLTTTINGKTYLVGTYLN